MSDVPSPPGVAPADPLLGLSIGNYTITAKLGEGGMGAVYLAEHPEIGKKVAVKVLLPEHSKRQDLISRFFTEAKTTAQLRHPALVEVFDFGFLPDGAGYLVMDFLEGESLAARLTRVAPLPPDIAAEIGRQLAAGVAAAHERGIVHRDLKPDNIFLVPDPELPGGERVKILDFGIAKLIVPGGTGSKGATSTGMLLGTPLYMAPEQCRGSGLVDNRADVYSTGCILYQMLGGRPPFDFEGVGEILAAHLYQTPRPLPELDPTLPADLVGIVMRALEKDPAARQQSMIALATELQTFLRGDAPAPSGRFSAGHAGASAPALPRQTGQATPVARPLAAAGDVVPAPDNAGNGPDSRPRDAASVAGSSASGPRGGGPSGTLDASALAGGRPSRAVGAHGVATAPTSFSEPPPRVRGISDELPTRKSGPPWLLLGFVVLTVSGIAGFFLLRERQRSSVPTSTADPGPDPGAAATVAADKSDPDPAKVVAGKVAVPDAGTAPSLHDVVAGGKADPGPKTEPKPHTDDLKPHTDPKPETDPKPQTGPKPQTSTKAVAGTAGGTRAGDANGSSRALALAEQAFRYRFNGVEDKALLTYRAALRAGGLPPAKRAEVDEGIITLSRKFGTIEILSRVNGARVSIDGAFVGKTPLADSILVLPGTHRVALEIPGFAPQVRSVAVAAKQKVIIPLKPPR